MHCKGEKYKNMNLVLLLLALLVKSIYGAKILALFPFPFYSHTYTFMPVFKELVARGHHLTFLSPYPVLPEPENWTNIVTNEKQLNIIVGRGMKHLVGVNRYIFFFNYWSLVPEVTEEVLKDKAIQSLLNQARLDYDVIISEPFVCHEALMGIGAKYNIPIVGTFPLTLNPWIGYFTGNDILPSYIPEYRVAYSDHMNFLERLDNTLLILFEVGFGLYHYLPKQEYLMEKYVYQGSSDHPALFDILKNIPIHLIDVHHSFAYARQYQPHTIPVGGLSIMNGGPLTKDLQEFLDTSSNGFIYLSFGSNLPVSSWGENALHAMLSVFKKINMNVLMKYENDTLAGKPSNVKISKWFPQPSILAHPKCRLFITHGGLHGISEATYHGVPFIGIPLFSDQLFNMKFAVEAGFGYQMLKEDITEQNFQQAIETVLNNKKYKGSAVKRSQIMKDRPDSAKDTAVYWIEYLLHHKDLSHLRPASASLPLYQLFLLDVFTVIFLFFILLTILLYYVTKIILVFFRNLRLGVRKTKKEN